MPFIPQDRRDIIDKSTGGLLALDKIRPGDRCYHYYKSIVNEWKFNPCWATVHKIYKDMLEIIAIPIDLATDYGIQKDIEEDGIAYQLAWQVFFQLHVMPYELQKMEEHGDI